MVKLKINYPNGFLNEETKCGHFVSKEIKKIWLVELDLLVEFDRICKKYDLSYCAIGGTQLGAVRHQGFIPWDDDIDVIMKRDQYEKLCEIAECEFQYPYFLQTNYSDFGATYGHAKLRNSETTCVFKCDAKYKKSINQGIFIDIFPVDNVVENEKLFKKQKRQAECYKKLAKFFTTATKEAYRWHGNIFVDYSFKILSVLSSPLNKKIANLCWKNFEKVCKRYNDRETEKFSILEFSYETKWMQLKKDYEELIDVPFEFTTIPICKYFDNALTMYFGDWHRFVKGGSHHEVFVNPNESYNLFFAKEQ